MRTKLLRQTGICFLVALAFFIARNSGISVLERGAETVLSHMAASYSVEDAKRAVAASKGLMVGATGKMEKAVDVMTGKPVYGEPIDEEFSGEKTPVYAVGGGQVTAVGENEEIGKYVKIIHGDQGESLYGNLYSVRVTVPANVKKGDIIGSYRKEKGKKFYFSLTE